MTLTPEARNELIPQDVLRIAIAVGAARSAVWARRNEATGRPEGITVDLGAGLADYLGVPFEYVEHTSSGHIVENAGKDVWDVTFVPVDAERKTRISFGTDYHLGDSTYLVRASSALHKVDDLNRPDLTIAGIEGTATLRSARRVSSAAAVLGAKETAEVIALFESGRADAIALGRESLRSLDMPGTRILSDYFHATGTAVAVPPERPLALEAVTDFIETAKTDGALRRIFDNNGFRDIAVAPLGSRS